MKQLFKSITVIAFALVISVSAGASVLAQETEPALPSTPVNNETAQTTRLSREQRVQQVQRTLERCEQIKTRLADRIVKSAEVRIAHTERYERIAARVDAVITSAESRNYDTAGLVAAKEAVALSITAYGEAIEAFTTQLREASELACDANPNEYGQAVVISRENLEAVRAAGAAVKTTFRENVVPELREYKTWLEENATTTENTEESAE